MCHCIEKELRSPSDAARWCVWTGREWEEQETVLVTDWAPDPAQWAAQEAPAGDPKKETPAENSPEAMPADAHCNGGLDPEASAGQGAAGCGVPSGEATDGADPQNRVSNSDG